MQSLAPQGFRYADSLQGMSHKCDAYVSYSELQSKEADLYRCNTSREVHDKRHRGIATLVQAIRNINGADGEILPGETPNRSRKKLEEIANMRWRDGIKKLDELIPDDWEDCNDPPDAEEADVSAVIPIRENTVSKKAQRAERKLAKNQARFDIVSTEDVSKVDAALHNGLVRGALDPLAHNMIEANIAFNPGTFKFGTLRQDVHTKKLLKNNGLPKIDEGETQREEAAKMAIILQRLGVSTDVLRNTRERKSLLAKLHEAIRYDLECVENEDRDTMMRMAGYWRYANRRTYNVMVRNNQLWDWGTGAKLEEVEEESEEDDMSSLDDRFSEMSTAATTPIIPHFSPDIDSCSEGFDLSAASALITSRAGTAAAVDEAKTPTQETFTKQADTRHLQTPTRVVAADPTATSSVTPSPSPKPVIPWTRPPNFHQDVNNRFSPLTVIDEDEKSVAQPTASTRPPTRPSAAFTIISRNRSPGRRVLFPALGRPISPTKGRRQQREAPSSGPKLGLPTREAGEAARGKGFSYAATLKRGL